MAKGKVEESRGGEKKNNILSHYFMSESSKAGVQGNGEEGGRHAAKGGCPWVHLCNFYKNILFRRRHRQLMGLVFEETIEGNKKESTVSGEEGGKVTGRRQQVL